MSKCLWASGEPIESYHDNEHGVMPNNNKNLFEMLCLEIFQPGLSFNIVLKKREGLRTFFKDYEIELIAKMTVEDVEMGLSNDNIIKHRLKIESVIHNAKLIVDQNINLKHYLFDVIDYRFGLENVGPLLSKQMKKDGFKFVGPSVTTSLLEAIGLLPAHHLECEYQRLQTNSIAIQTKLGAFYLEYSDYVINNSSLLHNSICAPFSPMNAFEQFLEYHLKNYFNHNIYNFKLKLNTHGTKFQEVVWDAIRQVPYGQTQTYGDIAYTIGSGAFRAVGGAASKSTFALFIPAHRIVSSSGIGGFQNQVELKRELLNHEGIDRYN